MPRIAIPKREDAPAESKPILDNVDKMLGFVPNLQRLMSISPNALSGWATLMGSLAKTLDVKTRDGIALGGPRKPTLRTSQKCENFVWRTGRMKKTLLRRENLAKLFAEFLAAMFSGLIGLAADTTGISLILFPEISAYRSMYFPVLEENGQLNLSG